MKSESFIQKSYSGLPDWISTSILSTSSPSSIISWLTWIPVMSANALVNVLDSYSWMLRISETQLTFVPLKGADALMNHSISAICWSLLSVEGWNSASTHFFAASTCCA